MARHQGKEQDKRPQQSKETAGRRGMHSCADQSQDAVPRIDMERYLCRYSPSEEILRQKADDSRVSDGNVPHQGELSSQRRKELKHRHAERKIDLHGRYRKDAHRDLRDFLSQAQQDGLHKVRIVHGKGHHTSNQAGGVLQQMVSEFLQEAKAAGQVREFFHPPECEGGKGATVVLLQTSGQYKLLY